MFTFRFIRYYFDHTNNKFVPVVFNCELPYREIQNKFGKGLQNEVDYKIELMKYGRCNIEIPIKSIP